MTGGTRPASGEATGVACARARTVGNPNIGEIAAVAAVVSKRRRFIAFIDISLLRSGWSVVFLSASPLREKLSPLSRARSLPKTRYPAHLCPIVLPQIRWTKRSEDRRLPNDGP